MKNFKFGYFLYHFRLYLHTNGYPFRIKKINFKGIVSPDFLNRRLIILAIGIAALKSGGMLKLAYIQQ